MAFLQTFDRQEVHIAEVPSINGTIYGALFRDCTITGPAILAILSDNELVYSRFQGDLDTVFWEVPKSRPSIAGAIGLRGCRFERCQFIGIGIAGPPELKGQFLPPGQQPSPPATPPPVTPTPAGGPINLIYVNEMTHSQIQQSTLDSVQYGTALNEDNRRAVTDLVNELRAALPDLGMDEEDLQEADAELAVAEAQAKSSRPKRPVIRQALANVENVLTKSSQVATTSVGLAEAIEKLHKLLPLI